MTTKHQTFTCKRDGLTIRGAQYFPPGFSEDNAYPAVIVSHGFTGNYLDGADFCERFAQMGYAAFCFSFCGGGRQGEDERYKSDGASVDMTIPSEIEDLITVKDYVKRLPYVNADALMLVGFSQGGFVSGLTAARCADEIQKLVMIYPALCIPDHARRGCLGGSSYDPANVPDVIDCGSTTLGKRFHETVVEMDPYLALAPYPGDVLLLQGLDDPVVNYSYAVRARECYRPEQCRLQLIRGLGHGFDKQQRESIFASIRQFVAGRREILTIRVIITRTETLKEDGIQRNHIYFTGYCDTPYFQGAILPGACDEQEYRADAPPRIRAQYTLTGRDRRGQTCSIHIVNQRGGDDWKPAVQTDSDELAWLNDADLTAVLEHDADGLTVRIFAERALS